MKEKTKKIILGYLPGFITGIIICGTISVIAATYFPSNDVTYDNSVSGLSSTDVQGAIDELYTECTTIPAGEQIIENARLEKDPYECRYFFTGADPNNYITFNDEEAGWRIISVECDGTIKIMRTASIGNQTWDSSNSNNWARPASLNTYLNSTYYNGLNATAKSQIVAKDWSIGAVQSSDNIANTINNENATKWNGKIAFVTASEFVRSNSNKNSCGTVTQLWNDMYGQCGETTWMHYSNDWCWTLSPYQGASYYVLRFGGGSGGVGYFYFAESNTNSAVRPTLYLSQAIKITGGDGTQSNPYEIEL